MRCVSRSSIGTVAIMALALLSSSGCEPRPGGMTFLAKRASLGKWEDKRPSGSIIMQDMLVLIEPRRPLSEDVPAGTYIVTTYDKMAGKIDDVVNDRIPVNRGTQLNFALGTTVDVRIEKALPHGERELVEDVRASFLEIIR